MMGDLAIVEDGVVVNRIIGEPGFAGGIECSAEVGIGWSYDGTDFMPPTDPEPEPEQPIVSVSARQFKLQLLAAGLIDDVEAWVGTQDRAVQIAYQNSGSFMRLEPMMQAGFAALGFTEEQIDAFFTAAAEL